MKSFVAGHAANASLSTQASHAALRRLRFRPEVRTCASRRRTLVELADMLLSPGEDARNGPGA
jgi:hypothetical protein